MHAGLKDDLNFRETVLSLDGATGFAAHASPTPIFKFYDDFSFVRARCLRYDTTGVDVSQFPL